MSDGETGGSRGAARDRAYELAEALRDPSRPLPAFVWVGFAALVSTILFLGLRLLVVRWAATGPPPPVAYASQPARAAGGSDGHERGAAPGGAGQAAGHRQRPPASSQVFANLVEGWRRAWVAKDVRVYLSYYAESFGSQGKDLATWSEHKKRAFANDASIEVEISDLRAQVSANIAIVTFVQTYRSEGYEDRGVKVLYLLAQRGEWKIFNEEWTPLGG